MPHHKNPTAEAIENAGGTSFLSTLGQRVESFLAAIGKAKVQQFEALKDGEPQIPTNHDMRSF